MPVGDDLGAAVEDACFEELALRGMRRVAGHRAELQLAEGISGFVTLYLDEDAGRPGSPVTVVNPIVGVRHEEATRLASLFLDVSPDGYSQPTMPLVNLVPSASFPRGWLLSERAEVDDVARRVVDDAVLYGFPFMAKLGSPSSLIDELGRPLWRISGTYVLAVLYMLDGRLAEAKKALMLRGLPKAQNPTTWGQGHEQFANFLDAFSAYFNVDLGIASWPVREDRQPIKELAVKIRDPNILREALTALGRVDLVDQVPRLDSGQLSQIGQRGAAIFRSGAQPDLTKAFGLAAIELLEPGGGTADDAK